MQTKIVWYQTTWIIDGKKKFLILSNVVSGNNFYQLSLWQVQKTNGQHSSKENVSGLKNLICGAKTLFRASLLPKHMETIFLNILIIQQLTAIKNMSQRIPRTNMEKKKVFLSFKFKDWQSISMFDEMLLLYEKLIL